MRTSRALWLSLMVFAVSVVASVRLTAQVFEVGGGTSSLYQAGGGAVTIHAKSYDLNIGAGTVDGHLLGGARLLKKTERGTYVVGDDRIDFRLPTDIFDTSHFLLVRGAGFSGVRHDLDIISFAGASSLEYNSPFFNASKASDPVGVLFLKKKLAPNWQFFSDTVVSRKPTEIVALQWTPMAKMEVAMAAGVGALKPFGAASLRMSRHSFDLEAAYIAASDEFRRITVASTLFAEPVRENVLVTWRPLSFYSISASRQNYLVAESSNQASVHSTIDQLSNSVRVFGAQVSGTVFHSTFKQLPVTQGTDDAAAVSVVRNFGPRIRLSSNYYWSKPKGVGPTTSFVTTVSETLTSRISVNETVNTSNGNSSVRFGGEFVSNLLTFSANYDTYYVPIDNSQPFQQALLLDVKFKVLGRLYLHGASFIDPTGRMRYTADARTILSREPMPKEQHNPMGRFVLHGCVMDTDGQPVEGAAVLIDEKPVYTDSTGCYYMRENKPRTHQLRVVISEFLVGGNWQVTSMPTTITSTTEEKSLEETVVVTVRKVREVSSTEEKKVTPAGREK